MSLKSRLKEDNYWPRVHEKLQEYKRMGWDINKAMTIVPVLFTTESKAYMSSHARRLIEHPKGMIAIDSNFSDLIIGLRSAVFDDRGQLDKEMTPHDDLLDAFQMICTAFKFKRQEG